MDEICVPLLKIRELCGNCRESLACRQNSGRYGLAKMLSKYRKGKSFGRKPQHLGQSDRRDFAAIRPHSEGDSELLLPGLCALDGCQIALAERCVKVGSNSQGIAE
jgi:hypothetical protein